VRRDGKLKIVSAEEVVPGDIVVLESGDVVTADMRLVEAKNLFADESTLTGESVPVEKGTEPAPADAIIAEQTSMAHKGTAITRGTGVGVAVATGMDTELGLTTKLVIEAANSPVTPRADELLRQRGIHVVPDILVNAGGVVVSYFEWTQNLQQEPWTLEQVNKSLEIKMGRAYQAVHQLADEKGVPWRTAALAIALRRVADAEYLRGGH